MKTERPTLKGKGAAIFLDDDIPENLNTVNTESQRYDKATFYLSDDLLNRLDRLWFTMRATNRKLRKSHLVEMLLDKAIKAEEQALAQGLAQLK